MSGISLVMATVGRVTQVQRFVDCLSAQSNRNFELIVVDQNPDDRLAPVLRHATALGITLLHLRQVEPNQCLARNAGLAAATQNLVAFPDDDCWYEADTLDLVLKRMSASDCPTGVLIRWLEQDPEGQPAHILDNSKWRSFREVDASMIVQFYRTELFKSIGGFDPAFGLHSWFGGAEETDLMFRISAAGVRVAYLPDAKVHHEYGIRTQQTAHQLFRSVRSRSRGTGALYSKHHLSAWVVARGIAAPLLRVLVSIHRPKICMLHIATALGRIEGLLRWR